MKPAKSKEEKMPALKPEELDPIVKDVVMNQRKTWHGDDPVHEPLFMTYGSEDGQTMLGQVTKINNGPWNAYDLQHTNEEGTGAHLIGSYQGIKQAQQAVEDYWAIVG